MGDLEVVVDLPLPLVGVLDGGAPRGAHGVVCPEVPSLRVAGERVVHSGGREQVASSGLEVQAVLPNLAMGTCKLSVSSVLFCR